MLTCAARMCVHGRLLGPYGACLCWSPPAFWREAAPLEQHDRNRAGAEHVECLPMGAAGYPTAFQTGAQPRTTRPSQPRTTRPSRWSDDGG